MVLTSPDFISANLTAPVLSMTRKLPSDVTAISMASTNSSATEWTLKCSSDGKVFSVRSRNGVAKREKSNRVMSGECWEGAAWQVARWVEFKEGSRRLGFHVVFGYEIGGYARNLVLVSRDVLGRDFERGEGVGARRISTYRKSCGDYKPL